MFKLFKSLRSKLLAMLILLLSLLSLVTGLATLNAMKRDSQQQARQILSVASKVFSQALDNRAAQLSRSVQLLASDFGFRRAVATTEQETIESVLSNHGNRINAELMLLLAPDGTLLARSDASVNADNISALFEQTQTNNGQPIADIISINAKSYQLVLAPVKAPTTIAWVGMGFPLDNTLAEQIKGITGLDISFTYKVDDDIRILSSTLEPVAQLALTPLLANIHNQQVAVNHPDDTAISQAMPLDQHQHIWALLHLSNQRWLSSYQTFRQQLLGIYGIGLSLALLFAFIFARSITRPIQALTQFARKVGQGLDGEPPKTANDEVGLLSRTLTTMQQDVRHREQQLLFNAEHDSLTRLYNRAAVERSLQHWLDSTDGSLLQLNIQQFKHINDVLGFSNGDQLLQQLAKRLQQLQPTPLLLARLGGDEFLLLFNNILLQEQVEQDLRLLTHGYQLDRSVINLKLCAGIYNYPAGQLSVNDAIRRVDIAMDNAKAHPQGIAYYQQGQDESHQRELTLIRDLPQALSDGQFFVLYQPKVNIQSQYCDTAEALIRWQHPEFGLIPPDQFIKLAEHSGNIHLITHWILRHVIAQTAAWWQAGLKVQVAVNLSVYDLLDPNLTDSISQVLSQHNLPARALALEVTESAVMQDAATVISQLKRLRDLGTTLSIDDFGTGQSSLAYLKQLPVHEVKIDRAFVKDIEHNHNDELIVAATTQLAHSLGFSVTAEGLENKAGLDCLLRSGCNKVQGYYFSRPLTAEKFSDWLGQFPENAQHWFNSESIV